MAVRRGAGALAAGLLVALPPLAGMLESTMTSHMLVQLPLLACSGWALGGWLLEGSPSDGPGSRRPPSWHAASSPLRWALLILAFGNFALWMIPRLLDLAVQSAAVDLAKSASLVLLGGLPLRLAWHHLGPVTKGLLHVEALASLWRMGWIYLDSPSRLCSQYRLADQQRLGEWLLLAGAVYALWLAWRALGPVPIKLGQHRATPGSRR